MHANISGADLYWESAGSGFPLICLHGYGVDHRSIKSAMEPVCKDGFQRFYLDLPGMGQSQTHPNILSSDDMLEMVCQFIEKILGPKEAFALAGYSYGGYLARGLLCQMEDRVKGMALLCPVVSFRRGARTLPAYHCCVRDEAFVQTLNREAFSQMDGFVTVQTKAVWEAYQAHILPALDLPDPRLMARIRDTEFSFAVDRPNSPWELPVLILAGRHDVSVGYEDAKRLVKNFSDVDFNVLEQAGHLPHMEAPDDFKRVVAGWLGRVAKGIGQ